MDAPLLPLFPLSLVLFPGMNLPLHIFEDRYKELMAEVIPGRKEFGVVLAKEDGIVNVGCTATVQEVIQRYPDGRLDLLALGRRRFELESLDETNSYLCAEVEYFDDEDSAKPTEELQRRVFAAAARLLRDRDGANSPEPRMNSSRLSFEFAELIADVDRRQTLLSLRSEVERLELLVKMLPEYAVQQERTATARRLAPLNGHAKHLVSS